MPIVLSVHLVHGICSCFRFGQRQSMTRRWLLLLEALFIAWTQSPPWPWGSTARAFLVGTFLSSNRRRLPFSRRRLASNRRRLLFHRRRLPSNCCQLPSHRRWLPFKCYPTVGVNSELAAARPRVLTSKKPHLGPTDTLPHLQLILRNPLQWQWQAMHKCAITTHCKQ